LSNPIKPGMKYSFQVTLAFSPGIRAESPENPEKTGNRYVVPIL